MNNNKEMGNKEIKSGGQIDWTDFNFPPCLKVVHFSVSELQQPQKGVVLVMLFQVFLVGFISLVNIINNIIQSEKFASIRVFYSFLNIFIFLSLQLFILHRGYLALVYDVTLLSLYKKVFHYLSFILLFIYILKFTHPSIYI